MPRLDAFQNSALLEATMCPESGQLIPFYEQVNSVLEICFARQPRDRATAFQLKTRFEKIRDALIGSEVVPLSHTQDLHDNTENSGLENSIEDRHVTVEQTLSMSLKIEII